MTVTPDREHLDDLLDLSKPSTTDITPVVATEIEHLRTASRSHARRVTHRRWFRPVAAGLAGAIVLGGAATAAAATGVWTNPWAHNPATSFTFTLPSGAVCEQRIGNVSGLEPDQVDRIESVFAGMDIGALLSPAAISAVVAERRAQGPGVFVNDDGTTEDSGYGTRHYSQDEEYWTAVWDIVVTAFDKEAALAGISTEGTDLTFSGEAHCPGADW